MAAVDAQDPAGNGVALTKSDTTVHSPPFRALYCGGTGDVAVRFVDGSTATFVDVPTGALLPLKFDKLLSTGTDATNVVGLR
jgi:hypothetical protein